MEYISKQSDNIPVEFIDGDERYADITLRSLKRALKKHLEYFALEDIGDIWAILVPTRKEYEHFVINRLGVNIEVPSNPARIAQPQRREMVFLSPSAYKEHSTFTYNESDYKRLVVHELTHVFEEHLSPDIEATPGWWGEGLAAYLSGQWKHEEAYYRPVNEGIKSNEIPSFEDIKENYKFWYDWAWTIIMFIEESFGREMINWIVRECADDNPLIFTGLSESELEEEWRGRLQAG